MDGPSSAVARYLVEGTPSPSRLGRSDGGPSDIGADNSHNSDNPDHPGFIIIGVASPSDEDGQRRIISSEEIPIYQLRLKTRCVNIYQFTDPAGRGARMAEANRISTPLYVGTDALRGVPVVAEGPAKSLKSTSSPDLASDFTGAAFVNGFTKTVASSPIPHIDLLRGEDQMLYIKRLTLGNRYPQNGPQLPLPPQRELNDYIEEENDRWLIGWPLRVKTLEPNAPPRFLNLRSTSCPNWSLARFYMLKVEGRLVPIRLRQIVAAYLPHLPEDILPLDFSVLMTFTFWVYTRFSVQTTERFAKDSAGNVKKQLPRVDLGVWLVYAPHYVRYHEEMGLSLYEHPFRFTHNHYQKDLSCFKDDASVPYREIPEEEVLGLIDGMGLVLADFDTVIPSSWVGSRHDYPGAPGLKPTVQNQRALAMPDVHTLGHPGYQVNTMPSQSKCSQGRRKVLVPKKFVPSHMASESLSKVAQFGLDCLSPYKRELINRYGQPSETALLLTTPKLAVVKDLESLKFDGPLGANNDDTILFPDSDPERMFDAYRGRRFPFHALIHPTRLGFIIACQEGRLSVGRAQGIRTEQLVVLDNGSIDWPDSGNPDASVVTSELAPMILSRYVDSLRSRIALAVREKVRLATLMVGFDGMPTWDRLLVQFVNGSLQRPDVNAVRSGAIRARERREAAARLGQQPAGANAQSQNLPQPEEDGDIKVGVRIVWCNRYG
ncbi:hypothetical protein CTA2_7223 [Colletotrichum tanaceti]|nr:hypothetical protein CTA2_7223 [Colletotrichum tanaceti]